MSRGHGRVQLQVLDFLHRFDEDARARGDGDRYVAVLDIAGQGASRSRIESVRRATKSLADEGLILLRTEDRHRIASRAGQLSAIHSSRGMAARLATASDTQARERAVKRELSA